MKGFIAALQGVVEAVRTQVNMKFHLVMTVVVVAAGFFFKIEPNEWQWIILSCGLVICIELINTAIEYLVNFISPDYHPMAGKIKDLSAAGVLIAAMTALVVGLIIFVPRVMFLLKYYK